VEIATKNRGPFFLVVDQRTGGAIEHQRDQAADRDDETDPLGGPMRRRGQPCGKKRTKPALHVGHEEVQCGKSSGRRHLPARYRDTSARQGSAIITLVSVAPDDGNIAHSGL
jgi:hypothetical protein